jgi:hypothetical protein
MEDSRPSAEFDLFTAEIAESAEKKQGLDCQGKKKNYCF